MKALAFLMVAVLLASCGGRSAADPPPAPVPAGLEAGCPVPSTELRFPGGDLPTGATRVRLCPGPPLTDFNGDPIGGTIQAPADLLTTDVAGLTSLVNQQDPVDDDIECTFDAGPVLTYWFGYPDGDWRAVEFGSFGCNLLAVEEDLRRRGGAELATAFTEAIMTQRTSRDTPRITQQATCLASPPASTYSGLVLDEVELASAAWCVNPRAQLVREVAVPPELVQRLGDGLWPGLTTTSRRPCGEAVTSWLEGITPWGDAVGFAVGPCGDIYPAHGATLLDDDEQHYLDPGLDAELSMLPLGPTVDRG